MVPPGSADFEIVEVDGLPVMRLRGAWTIGEIADAVKRLDGLGPFPETTRFDLTGLERMDTSGAFLLARALGLSNAGVDARMAGGDQRWLPLLKSVGRAGAGGRAVRRHEGLVGFGGMLERLGRGAVSVWREAVDTLAFVGEALTMLARQALRPASIRWRSTFAIAEQAGLDALPIVAFLSFFVGMVVAFIGATSLEALGASLFVVELVGISVLREFGVIITAIILAGRTNSAFTAQIGAMKMRQEIDALRVLGLHPMQVLVVPRVLAMLMMVPVLTFVATVFGVLGGLAIAWMSLDIAPGYFLNRLLEGVPIQNLWVGLSKAPAVALIVALIGCRQGLNVGSSVQSLGAATTASVVHAIFAIIVMDALFALFYLELGI
jgi:phospholipid/cholesterol/gamma-HCH transport system permease protein